jgi:hypothetical protein
VTAGGGHVKGQHPPGLISGKKLLDHAEGGVDKADVARIFST